MEDNVSRKEFVLKGKDDRLYSLMILNEQDKITFKSNIIDNIWNIQYVLSINITKFHNINKIFKKYNSINGIFIKYFNDIKNDKINISLNDNKIIVYFSSNDIAKIPFILEHNEMKLDNIILKLCDKIQDIDSLKIELAKKKIENDKLKNELIKIKNDNDKNISEMRKEIDNLKEEINSLNKKELYDNKLENKSSKIKAKNSDEIKQLNKSNDKCKKMNSDNDKIIKKLIYFEKDEIKLDLNIKKAKFFEIENIKLINLGNDKGFKNLYMVIDTNTSSPHILFATNARNCTSNKLTLDGPLLKWETLNNLITLTIKEPKIGEYTIFTYIREKPDGDNLSFPFKITINVIEDPEEIRRKEQEEQKDYFKREEDIKRILEKIGNIDYKGVDKIKVEETFNFVENEYNISSIFDREEVLIKIIEFNCDIQKINEWIIENL